MTLLAVDPSRWLLATLPQVQELVIKKYRKEEQNFEAQGSAICGVGLNLGPNSCSTVGF